MGSGSKLGARNFQLLNSGRDGRLETKSNVRGDLFCGPEFCREHRQFVKSGGCVPGKNLQSFIIDTLGLNQNHYASTLILLIKIIPCSKIP